MDEYSFISENGNIRQIRDLIAKEKDEQQDVAINEINSKINRLGSYSESETEIGTWLDGKSIFRKVILFSTGKEITASGTVFTLAELGLSGIDNIFKIYGFNTTGSKNGVRRFTPMYVYWVDNSSIQIRNNTNLTSYYLGVIIEYTKNS